MRFLENSTVELVQALASDEMVIRAARVSTDGDDRTIKESDYRLIDYLLRNRHTSPLEHGSFTFMVQTPIFIAREFMRHRTGSYNEISGRYSKLPDDIYIISSQRPVKQTGKVGEYRFEPAPWLARLARWEQWWVSRIAWWSYKRQLRAGVAREVARMVLPVNTMTRFYVTFNPLNVLRFLSLRTENETAEIVSHPQYEIDEVAREIERLFAEVMPRTYEAWNKYGRR